MSHERTEGACVGCQALATDLGWIGIAFDGRGLRRVLLRQPSRRALLRALAREGIAPVVARPPAPLEGLAEALARYLEGGDVDPARLPVRFAWDGVTPFRRRVYRELRRVRLGTVVTYGELGRRVGAPAAARGVGQAMARNPFPLVVPCHRVVGAGGRLGGFSAPGALGTKRRLLELEDAVVAVTS